MNITLNCTNGCEQVTTVIQTCVCGQDFFWTIRAGFGTSGGNPSNEPTAYLWEFQDCATYGTCGILNVTAGVAQADWVAANPHSYQAMSSGIAGVPKLTIFITNYDVYPRIYTVTWDAGYQ